MDQVKIVEDSLITSIFLKVVFANFTWSILEYLDPNVNFLFKVINIDP